MTGSRWLWLGAFGLALVVNPYLACSSQAESDFTYSEDEMKRVVLGTWQGSALLEGETVAFSLTLEQARAKSKAPGAQPQCASRSFVKPAAACIATTSMPVVGTLTSVSPELNGAVDGGFTAFRTLDSALLELRLESGTVLSGTVKDDALADGTLRSGVTGSFSLQRP